MVLQASNFTQSDKKNDKDRQQMTENESVTKLHLGNSYVPYIGDLEGRYDYNAVRNRC